MTYFLDFDRTLFDIDSYNRSLLDNPACAPFRAELEELLSVPRGQTLADGTTREEVWMKISGVIASGELAFAPGELAHFVYGDVPEFLRMLGNEAIIITYGEMQRQKAKIESALAGIVRLTVLYTGSETKADYLKRYPHLVPQDALFVDDWAQELETVGTAFPQLKLYEMRRDSGAGDGRFPVIHSLSELPI